MNANKKMHFTEINQFSIKNKREMNTNGSRIA